MLDDYLTYDPENGAYYAPARHDFSAYMQSLLDEEQGLNLAPGMVPCSHRWLLSESGACVGVVRIRHNIDTEFLANEAGHIGYDVAPSFRGRGYGVACLEAGIVVARELGIDRILLYADSDNPASWKVRERCGGVLGDERCSAHYVVLVRRYWIDVAR
jgi:predicted acetyltransferase